MSEERDADELRVGQRERERTERELADEARDAEEEAQHQRRAEKAAYLREKLEERAQSERDS